MRHADIRKLIEDRGRECADLYTQGLPVKDIADFMSAKMQKPVTRSLIYYWIRAWRGSDLFTRGVGSAQEAAKKYTDEDLKRWRGYMDAKMDVLELGNRIKEESGCSDQQVWKYIKLARKTSKTMLTIDTEYRS